MKLGLRYLNVGVRDAGYLVEIARAAEEAGVESLWVSDHVAVPGGSAEVDRARVSEIYLDPFVSLSYVAAVTRTIGLGIAVLVLPLRHPLLVAKSAAALHALAGGRCWIGVGCGWLEPEFRALGVDFSTRGAATDEYIQAMRTAWSADITSFKGTFIEWRNMAIAPCPGEGSIPIVVGGQSTVALHRAIRLGDQFFPTGERRFVLARELRRQHREMEVSIGLAADGSDIDDAMGLADRIVLPVCVSTRQLDFSIRDPEDVERVVERVLSYQT